MKEQLFQKIEDQKEKLWEMADFIFDHPEYEGKEYQAAELLTGYLEKNGFQVERGIAGYETAFRAVYELSLIHICGGDWRRGQLVDLPAGVGAGGGEV